jgi:hypothetical protein
VRFGPDELAGHATLQFTRRLAGEWEGVDHAVLLHAPAVPHLVHHHP